MPSIPITSGEELLVVEDVFSIGGRGIVVTGRVIGREVRVGQCVQVRRTGQVIGETEVTGLEQLGALTDVASAGADVRVMLRVAWREDVQRGDILTV